ncbi:putative nucleotidyltransferase [Candidatus Methanoperedens nitroreducens]|uniref:Putative nucleotidyltransferase n=1 Tax=Candidatus Methanoperedens nitratireducens TaxID=1392998 RepID=A0A062UVH2_9EURY|nr:nucleotidyltransferase domain-containing protein [Candidatus Methanoperedens nitroreducens]KCZ71016.1 putative nucleotidyltransferase [Candidatus Methanoperedens nitroreducens]MDJ1421614.1 nucleotidyltransferase domain-containing protein [Candidatus Methanoperedens sp.]
MSDKEMDSKQEISDKLKRILSDLNIKYSKILLFGSRARGDFREESDWDLLIVLKKPLDAKTKKELWFEIYKKLHEFYPFISFDIILKDAESFEEEKTIANTISNEVYLEGIEA